MQSNSAREVREREREDSRVELRSGQAREPSNDPVSESQVGKQKARWQDSSNERLKVVVCLLAACLPAFLLACLPLARPASFH